MERMFVNPSDGEMHSESYYQREGISLDQVIEVFDRDGGLVFEIIPEHLEKMTFGDNQVLDMIASFVTELAVTSLQSDDPEEAEQCASVAGYISRIMMEKLSGKKMVRH